MYLFLRKIEGFSLYGNLSLSHTKKKYLTALIAENYSRNLSYAVSLFFHEQ